MKSIRVSLLVYFLLLLAAGLGTASVLAYRTAVDSLRDKQTANRELSDTLFREREHDENEQFDEQLLAKAQIVAHLIQTRYQGERTGIVRLVALGLATESQAHLFAHLWLGQATTRLPFTPLTPSIKNELTTQIQINDAELPRDAEAGAAEYYQVDHESGITWPPVAPGEAKLFKPGAFDPNKHVESKADDVTLPNGKTVRRVQLKFVPVTRIQFNMGRRRGPLGPNGPPRDRPPPLAGAPWYVVHCAVEPVKRDAAVARLRAAFALSSEEQAAQAQEDLAGLRRRLLLIACGAFLATTLGGFLLVGLGLAPLKRLSDAVSRVTSRDFRLPLNGKPLPVELAPIASRLRGTLDELRRAFEREKHATADISHELRTPVAALMTTLGVALKKPRSAAEYRQTLEDCQGIGRQLRQLVERIMALAKLDSGADRFRPRAFDAGELAADCAALVKPLATARGLEVRVHCPKPAEWATDADKLREVLVNLLHNAVEYNKPGGAVDVTVQPDGDFLDVQVHDTGVGIAPEAFEHIFERFYRADPSRQNSELHAGLGLSIVKGYVELLGGTVSVSSAVGQGSTFRVRLPRARPDPK